MPKLAPMSGNHINLSVSDLDRSVEWYCRVLGLTVVGSETEVPADCSTPLRYRSLGDLATMSYVVGLFEHEGASTDGFDHRRSGLDHFAMHVPTPEDVTEWSEHLTALGIEHDGPKVVSYETTITFRDPDGIQLELACPNMEFWAGKFISATEG